MKTTPALRISALVLQIHTQHPAQAWRMRVATACCALLLASALPLAAQTPSTGATTSAPAVSSTDVPSTPEWQAWRQRETAERKLSAEQWMQIELPCREQVVEEFARVGRTPNPILLRSRVSICVSAAEIAKAQAGIAKAQAEGDKARAGIAKAQAEGDKAQAGIAKAEAEGILQKKIIAELAKPREKQDLAALKGFVGELQKFLPHTVVENQIKVLEEIIAMRRERKQP